MKQELTPRGEIICRGRGRRMSSMVKTSMTQEQHDWMLKHKPLYYTGDLRFDLPHLPKHLRHV